EFQEQLLRYGWLHFPEFAKGQLLIGKCPLIAIESGPAADPRVLAVKLAVGKDPAGAGIQNHHAEQSRRNHFLPVGRQLGFYGAINWNGFALNLGLADFNTIAGEGLFTFRHPDVAHAEIVEGYAHDLVNFLQVDRLCFFRGEKLHKAVVRVVSVQKFFDLVLEKAAAEVIASGNGDLLYYYLNRGQ